MHVLNYHGATACGIVSHGFSTYRITKDNKCVHCLKAIILEYSPVSGIYKAAKKQLKNLEYEKEFEGLINV